MTTGTTATQACGRILRFAIQSIAGTQEASVAEHLVAALAFGGRLGAV